MAKTKKTAKPLKPTNWLKEKITKEALLKIGFEKVKISKRLGNGISHKSRTTIDNLMDHEEAVYFAAEDVVMVRSDERWILFQDSCLDNVWQGKLKTMGDVMTVLCLLSR